MLPQEQRHQTQGQRSQSGPASQDLCTPLEAHDQQALEAQAAAATVAAAAAQRNPALSLQEMQCKLLALKLKAQGTGSPAGLQLAELVQHAEGEQERELLRKLQLANSIISDQGQVS